MAGCAALGAVALALACAVPATAAPASACDRFASPRGSNQAPGSRERPVRTVPRLAGLLRRGETGCLRKGKYHFSELSLATRGITLAPLHGRRVTLVGDIKFLPAARGAAIRGLRLDGSGGAYGIGPRIYAHRVTLTHNDITNRNRGICVQIGAYFSAPPPRSVLISDNRIHHCGQLPATNRNHGVYIASARETVVRGNWIYENADRGVQQYPDAQGSRITGNVIESNGQGVNFGGSHAGSCSNDNVVAKNVIASSTRSWNIYSGGDGPSCARNVARHNCVHAGAAAAPLFAANGGVESPSRSFESYGNIIARPRYVNRRADNFHLRRRSRCARRISGRIAPRRVGAPRGGREPVRRR